MQRKNQEKAGAFVIWLMRIFPAALLIAVAVTIGVLFRHVTVEDVLRYTPENLFLAALALLGAYLIKSLSVFFPLLILYISSGILFSPPAALAVNLCGLVITVTVPYFLGILVGKEWMEQLLKKYKKARQLERFAFRNEWFLSYILRVINLLPGDIVSMFLGSIGVRYPVYLCGSLIGLAPTMLAATLMGINITDPTSAAFILSCILTLALSAASILIYRHMLKTQRPPQK